MSQEYSTLKFIKSRRLRGTYLDIGYGSGTYTKYFSEECETSLVLAVDGDFERSSSVSEILPSKSFGGSRIWCLNAYVSTKSLVYWNPRPEGEIRSFISEAKLSDLSVMMNAVSIDGICNNMRSVDLIRINTNNHELEVIKSADRTLVGKKPEICIRCGVGNEAYISAFLRKYNYVKVKEFKNHNLYFIHVSVIGMWIISVIEHLPYSISRFIKWRRLFLEWNGFWRRRSPQLQWESAPSGMQEIY